MCPTAKYVLKTDDDVFVDTYHLPLFLDRYRFDRKSNFLLCFVVKGNKPWRNETTKWYVTKEEYAADEYPPYCAGPAYLTKIKTMKKILGKVQSLNYLYIDDVLFTGIAAQNLTSHYDWAVSFLEYHLGEKEVLLSASLPDYTPELLVAMDLSSVDILILFQKAKRCHDHASHCYKHLTKLPFQQMQPPKVTKNSHKKTEL